MLSGEAAPLLDDFAVTGTSLLYCDRAQNGQGLTPIHPREREFYDGERASPRTSPVRGRLGGGETSVEVVEAGHVLAGDLAAHAR